MLALSPVSLWMDSIAMLTALALVRPAANAPVPVQGISRPNLNCCGSAATIPVEEWPQRVHRTTIDPTLSLVMSEMKSANTN